MADPKEHVTPINRVLTVESAQCYLFRLERKGPLDDSLYVLRSEHGAEQAVGREDFRPTGAGTESVAIFPDLDDNARYSLRVELPNGARITLFEDVKGKDLDAGYAPVQLEPLAESESWELPTYGEYDAELFGGNRR